MNLQQPVPLGSGGPVSGVAGSRVVEVGCCINCGAVKMRGVLLGSLDAWLGLVMSLVVVQVIDQGLEDCTEELMESGNPYTLVPLWELF